MASLETGCIETSNDLDFMGTHVILFETVKTFASV
jgi:hypothetical protein